MNQIELITPILTLIIWTFLIFLMMAFGRVRFMKNPQDAAHSTDYKNQLPDWVNRTGDNYNHLFEQPVAFYAVTLSIALINNFDNLIVQLAWTYVVIRIIHSFVQIIVNIILLRFLLFASGWLVIAYMALSQIF
tara:strand:- start:702 stop:1103 length:402 start_codon:yes stop_codon:yes gene_type:complete